MRLFAPIITGSTAISGSLTVNGVTTVSGNASTLFLIKNFAGNNILTVSQSGVVTLATQSVDLTGTAPNGGIYFTSSSLFIGLD